MHTLTIAKSPLYSQAMPPWRVPSVSESIHKKLRGEKLTKENAIPILKKIKFEADLGSLLCKPIVHLPLLAMLSVGGLSLYVSTHHIALLALGLLPLGFIPHLLLDISKLHNASIAYSKKSYEVAGYLYTLEHSTVVKVVCE